MEIKMAGKQHAHPTGNGGDFPSTEMFSAMSAVVTQAAERNRQFMETALDAWSREAQRFYDEMSTQGAAAFDQLKTCKSPLDVFGVEQAWLSARSKSYMDAGARMAQTFTEVAQGKPATPAA